MRRDYRWIHLALAKTEQHPLRFYVPDYPSCTDEKHLQVGDGCPRKIPDILSQVVAN